MKPRIGFISTYPPVHCGIGEYTRRLSHAIISVKPSARVTVFATREARKEPYSDGPITVIPSFDRGGGFDSILKALEDIGGVDVLHLQHEYGIFGETPAIIEAMLEAKRRGLVSAVVATLHTVYHPKGVERGASERLRLFQAAKALDTVVVHSIIQEFELISQGLPYSLVKRIPHGTSINIYVDTPRHVLAERLGLGTGLEGRRVLAVPGFMRPDKGLSTLLKAFNMLGSGDTVLVVAGEPQGKRGGEAAALVEKAASQGRNIVLLRRYLSEDELLMLAALSDVIVLPYEDRPGKYSVSGVLHVSMGSLKPIIGTRVPRLVELYQLAPRMVVEPRNPEALAAKIKWVLENYDTVIPYMGPVFSYAVRTMWPRMARRHLHLYRSLA